MFSFKFTLANEKRIFLAEEFYEKKINPHQQEKKCKLEHQSNTIPFFQIVTDIKVNNQCFHSQTLLMWVQKLAKYFRDNLATYSECLDIFISLIQFHSKSVMRK